MSIESEEDLYTSGKGEASTCVVRVLEADGTGSERVCNPGWVVDVLTGVSTRNGGIWSCWLNEGLFGEETHARNCELLKGLKRSVISISF